MTTKCDFRVKARATLSFILLPSRGMWRRFRGNAYAAYSHKPCPVRKGDAPGQGFDFLRSLRCKTFDPKRDSLILEHPLRNISKANA